LSRDEMLALATLLFRPAALAVKEMIVKEEQILFPMCLDHITEGEWAHIHQQTLEIGYCLYDPPLNWKPEVLAEDAEALPAAGRVQLPTGSLSLEELTKVFNSLPVDITFVDKDDKVKYFSQAADRIFTRSRAIINRDVRHCHPPSSV
ncbi:MAG TPA: PAS domain-containing protein, partial [Bacteroidales bacterium]|nr:PAS domain-containing protein [Bacteroidales bacterium]